MVPMLSSYMYGSPFFILSKQRPPQGIRPGLVFRRNYTITKYLWPFLFFIQCFTPSASPVAHLFKLGHLCFA